MDENQLKEFNQMKATLAELKAFIDGKADQQIAYPLDYASQQIIQINLPVVSGGVETGGAPYTNTGYLPVRVNGTTFLLMVTS